jgi:hypothetical protein
MIAPGVGRRKRRSSESAKCTAYHAASTRAPVAAGRKILRRRRGGTERWTENGEGETGRSEIEEGGMGRRGTANFL